MAVFDPEIDRKILPRWRTFDMTLNLGELGSGSMSRLHQGITDGFLASRIADWKRYRTVGHAADLVGTALAIGKETLATEAASFLLQDDLSVSIWVRELARKVLDSPSDKNEFKLARRLGKSEQHAHIRFFRQCLRIEPRDPIIWVDLARVYSILGQRDQAKKCMTAAQQLAADNRFVLRSAGRFWIHLGDPERAHDLIVKSKVTRNDPWILAAEIATSSASGKTSKFVKAAYRMLSDSSYRARHLSELASAVATLELSSGNIKKARKLFARSLMEPTENSIAQAAWAVRKDPRIHIENQHLKSLNAFEARSRVYYASGKWEKIIAECWNWQSDQPFSSGPSISGSYISAVALENYSESESFAKYGLIANSSNFTLLNNLAFALINSGKLGEAINTLSKIDDTRITRRDRAILQATRGFLSFRQRNISEGQKLYLDALSIARTTKEKKLVALASVFHAMEWLNFMKPEGTHVVFHAIQALEKDDPISNVLECRLKKKAKEKGINV